MRNAFKPTHIKAFCSILCCPILISFVLQEFQFIWIYVSVPIANSVLTSGCISHIYQRVSSCTVQQLWGWGLSRGHFEPEQRAACKCRWWCLGDRSRHRTLVFAVLDLSKWESTFGTVKKSETLDALNMQEREKHVLPHWRFAKEPSHVAKWTVKEQVKPIRHHTNVQLSVTVGFMQTDLLGSRSRWFAGIWRFHGRDQRYERCSGSVHTPSCHHTCRKDINNGKG